MNEEITLVEWVPSNPLLGTYKVNEEFVHSITCNITYTDLILETQRTVSYIPVITALQDRDSISTEHGVIQGVVSDDVFPKEIEYQNQYGQTLLTDRYESIVDVRELISAEPDTTTHIDFVFSCVLTEEPQIDQTYYTIRIENDWTIDRDSIRSIVESTRG